MECIGTGGEKIFGLEAVVAQDGDVRQVGVIRLRLDLEGEGGCEG